MIVPPRTASKATSPKTTGNRPASSAARTGAAANREIRPSPTSAEAEGGSEIAGTPALRHAIGGPRATKGGGQARVAPHPKSHPRFRAQSYAPVAATPGGTPGTTREVAVVGIVPMSLSPGALPASTR